ncbi:SDR family oxidoreductase [Candidatus Saccharibacteria bacterium CPR2]|nr:SDR family oxidoreductase [Candidatus Saccharibacteria bacterium CPR2]
MQKFKVAILGCTGMLGAITLDSFVQSGDFEVVATYRKSAEAEEFIKGYLGVDFRVLDTEKGTEDEIAETINGIDWVVNAIGVIKPYIHDDNAAEVERATRINALFPHLLAKAAQKTGAEIIQIATDCVYSGQKGQYVESDAHDALDVYGKTKSLGEAHFDNIHHVRCSIIGPELKGHLSLMDWFLGNPKKAELNGFTNHQWNGVTTLHFARICQGIIKNSIKLPHIQHVIPGNSIAKSDLLKSFAKEFGRGDIKINSVKAPTVVDRTLATSNEKLNKEIWSAAGYSIPPTIEQMVFEVASYGFPKKGQK